MAVSLIPVGPNVPASVAAILQSHDTALGSLMQPVKPTAFAIVDLIAKLPAASDWRGCCVLCAENNSLVCSTEVAGTWTWLRADGSAL